MHVILFCPTITYNVFIIYCLNFRRSKSYLFLCSEPKFGDVLSGQERKKVVRIRLVFSKICAKWLSFTINSWNYFRTLGPESDGERNVIWPTGSMGSMGWEILHQLIWYIFHCWVSYILGGLPDFFQKNSMVAYGNIYDLVQFVIVIGKMVIPSTLNNQPHLHLIKKRWVFIGFLFLKSS